MSPIYAERNFALASCGIRTETEHVTKRTISLVGAGNVATALGVWLRAAGYRVDEVIVRPSSLRRARALAGRTGARGVALDRATFGAQVVWLCVPDDAIATCASGLAQHAVWKGKTVLHSSGALTSDVLGPLRAAGAVVASVHPMMTFVRGARPPAAAGIPFAVEGDARAVSQARRILRALGGEVVTIRAKNKPLYHALGAFASPLIVAELAVAESIARAAGITPRQARRTIAPILRRTLENYLAHGAAAAFSGPLVRGDVGTIRKHLDVLRTIPGAREAYVALARAALRELPVGNRTALRRLLRA
jgi:predicted short-subunit dehydrogenase-like oxidoreductase (DUF2520 family)